VHSSTSIVWLATSIMPRVKRLRSWDSYGLTLVITCIDAICDRLRALAGRSRSCWVGSFFSSSACSYEMPNAPEITSEVGPTGGLVCGEPDFAALDHCYPVDPPPTSTR